MKATTYARRRRTSSRFELPFLPFISTTTLLLPENSTYAAHSHPEELLSHLTLSVSRPYLEPPLSEGVKAAEAHPPLLPPFSPLLLKHPPSSSSLLSRSLPSHTPLSLSRWPRVVSLRSFSTELARRLRARTLPSTSSSSFPSRHTPFHTPPASLSLPSLLDRRSTPIYIDPSIFLSRNGELRTRLSPSGRAKESADLSLSSLFPCFLLSL